MEVIEKPPLVVYPHALIGDGRIIRYDAPLSGETLGAYVHRIGVAVPRGRIRIWHNGCRVPDALWMHLIPRMGDQIVIRQLPAGGGDGGKILRTVAMVALVIVSAGYGAVLGTALGFTGATATAVGSSIIMIGGSLLINTLLPPLTASTAAAALSASTQTNPSYTLSGGQNQARTWQPMMLIFGRCKIVPDLGANYYTEYVGDTQYLNQVFHFGLQLNGVRDEGYYIGDTPIENYQGVQLQLPDPNTGALSMFPGNVDTIQGFALNSSVVNSRTTSLNTTHISIELAASLFYVNDQGGMDARSVDLRIQYRPVGGAWVDVGLLQDAVYASHYWALMRLDSSEYSTTETQVSYGSTNPSDHTDGDTVILREGSSSGGDSDLYTPPVHGVWRWKVHPTLLPESCEGNTRHHCNGVEAIVLLLGSLESPAQLGIEHIAAYSPEARGRSERAFGTHQERLPRELAKLGITDMARANRYLQQQYMPRHNQEFTVASAQPGSTFVAYIGTQLPDILCEQFERTVGNDNCVNFEGLVLQIPPDDLRYHYVKRRVRVHRYVDGTLAVFYGPRCLARYDEHGAWFEPLRQWAA